MADNKKYYYLKLKDNFFDSDEVIILESMPDGTLYSNILLKLYLKSLKSNGRLMFNDKIPYNPTILAQLTRHTVGTVEKSLGVFEALGLIEILDNGAIFMSDIQNFIGKSTTEADRKREYRALIEEEKQTDVGQMSDKTTPELEIEKELNKDIYKNIVQISKADLNVFFEKLWKLYPNKKGKAQISDSKKKALHLIGEDKLIICIERYKTELKNDEWRKPQNGSTFFNGGYIDYLDENYEPCKAQKQSNNKFNNFDGRDYDIDDLERKMMDAQEARNGL